MRAGARFLNGVNTLLHESIGFGDWWENLTEDEQESVAA